MAECFKVGDHVTWNSEAGHVRGTIVKKHTKNVDYKGYTHHASKDDPQYEIKSDKTDHIAIHKWGFRHCAITSANIAWNNLSFRGYADYMQTPKIKESLDQLTQIAAERQTAIMCAEAVPWRCHRSLIGDALLIRNISVVDIMTEKTSRPHALTPFAKVDGNTITYPGTTV